MAPLTEYELQRLKRIEENRRRMEELGVVQALQAIAASQVATQCSPAVPRAPRRPPRFVVLTEEDLRRSGRAKKEVDYNEHSLFKHAEAALRQAEARPQRIVVREWKQRGGGAGQGVRIRGWHESYGTAGHEAQERCMHEAHRLADSLANPAFMKVLTPSMVSGGFWCSAPRGLKDELGISSKCAFTAYLPEGQTVPTDACRLNAAGDGWDIVWLPHGKKGSSFGFSGNWVGFAVDNRLFPGDCLVCEVLPKEEPRGPTAFSLRFHALRAYDYEEDDGVKAACQAAWGTRAPMEEGDAIEDDAVEEAAVEEEGVEVDAVEDEVAEEEALQVDAVEEEGDSALQQAGEGQQQHKEGPPAVEAAAAVELSDREAEEREGPDGGATDAACAPAAAPPSATPKRKRQTLMTEAAASKRPRRTSGGGQASDAAAAKQQGKPKSPSTTAAGKRATKQRPAKKLAANAGRGARKQTARAPAAAVEAEAEAKAEAEAAPAGQEKQEEEEVSYEVECILGFKGRGAGRRVHIKWWGYKETTWEPLSMLDQALEAYPLAPGLIL